MTFARIGIAIAILAAGAACGGRSSHDVDVEVVNPTSSTENQCGRFTDGDSLQGAEVKIEDNKGVALSTATLEVGKPTSGPGGGPACRWTVSLKGVSDSPVYTFAVIRRGQEPYTQDLNKSDLEARHWKASLLVTTS